MNTTASPMRPAQTPLQPVFLLAATINAEGFIELPAVFHGRAYPLLRALFMPGDDGALLQLMMRAGDDSPPAWEEARPLDTTFFARCIEQQLGRLTPELFLRQAEAVRSHGHDYGTRTPLDVDAERADVIRGAFNAFLLA